MASFIIFSLPRSRTRWLSEYLSYGRPVAHDLAIGCRSVEEFLARLDDVEGSVETGAVIGYRLLRHLRPDVRQLTLTRPFRDILSSLTRAGFAHNRNELVERRALLEMAAQEAEMTFTFDELNDAGTRQIIFEYLLDVSWDEDWDRRMVGTKVEVERGQRLKELEENREATEELKRDLAQLLLALPPQSSAAFNPEVEVGLEPFAQIWPEVSLLGARHSNEVGDDEWKELRPFSLDAPALQAAEEVGAFRVITARAAGLLIGYLTLQIYRDPESVNKITADQGAWYVAPEFARRGIGVKLFDEAIRLLRENGVTYWFPHHRLLGRGDGVGKFLKSRGAIEIKHEYMMVL